VTEDDEKDCIMGRDGPVRIRSLSSWSSSISPLLSIERITVSIGGTAGMDLAASLLSCLVGGGKGVLARWLCCWGQSVLQYSSR